MQDFDEQIWIDIVFVGFESTMILHLILPEIGFVMQILSGTIIGFYYPIIRIDHYRNYLGVSSPDIPVNHPDYDQRLIELGLMEPNEDHSLEYCCQKTQEEGRYYCTCGKTVIQSIKPLVFL
jgi:hypothetical protein